MMKITAVIFMALCANVSFGAELIHNDFEEHGINETLISNTMKYDYTSGGEYDSTNALPNTLAFNIGSSADYIIQDRGAGHERCLYITGGSNFSDANRGVFFTKLDLTASGANPFQKVRVSWSFDILGTSDDEDFDSDNWAVLISHSSDPILDVTGVRFESAAVAQTFSFTNAGRNGTNGWTTVSGYYDLSLMGATQGMIQITGTQGGYVSSGDGLYCLDNVTVTVTPLLATMDIDFDMHVSDEVLMSDTTKYDYILDNVYDPLNAAVNTLAFNIGSLADYIIQDRGPGHEKCLYINGSANMAATQTGIFFTKLDMTAGGLNDFRKVRVSWSFDVLGTSDDEDFNPTNWQILVNSTNLDSNLDVNDDGFISAPVAQMFTFINAGKNGTNGWTTIIGGYDVPVGNGSSLGAIQITGTSGSYAGAGQGLLCLDNIEITVSPVEDVFSNFEEYMVGDVLMSDTTKYDYTSDDVYDPSNAAVNTLAFNIGSTADYFIQDRGPGHEKCLYINGSANMAAAQTGIFLMKLDMTAGGLNTFREVRVNWSFDILGTSDDADFNPTHWQVLVNSTNTDVNLDVNDDGFISAPVAQTFTFTNAGKIGTNGWTTVTGGYDVPVGEGSSLGAIQITGTLGGYAGAGQGLLCLDNMVVEITPVRVGHPRLFFSKEDVAQLAALRFTTHSNEWAQLIEKCENLKNSTPPTDPRNESNILYREDQLVAMALVQLIDPSLPYQSTSTNWFWTMLNWEEWGEGYWGGEYYGPSTDLGTGEILKALTVWYDLQYQNLTPVQREEISAKLADCMERFYESHERFLYTQNGRITANHCWNSYLSMAAVLYGVDGLSSERAEDWSGLLDERCAAIRDLKSDFMTDGATGEGGLYWMFGLEKILHWSEMRRVAGGTVFTDEPWFQNTGLYGLHLTLPGGDDNFGGIARFSDANQNFWGNPYNELALLANRTRDPVAQWMATELDHVGANQMNAYRYLFYDPSLEAEDPAANLNNWHFFNQYGLFMWRTSWANDASYFAIRSGQHSHAHDKPDDGQFMIHRAGIPYIANLGYSIPKYTQDSNVLLVDGTGQYSDGDDWGFAFTDSWPANSNTWGRTRHLLANTRASQNGDFFNVLIDPTAMYTNSALSQWDREVVGISGDFYLLRDTVSAESSVTFDLLLHAYVTAKGPVDVYDDETYRTNNPWTVLSSKRWEINARAEAPGMRLKDLSINNWSGTVEESWYYKQGYSRAESYRKGNKLKRSLTGTDGSSLMSFGFIDLMSGWTQAVWAASSAEGVHVTSSVGSVIDVLWPVDRASCTNSADWTVSGKMAGRRYDSGKKCYFAREVTSVVDNGLSLIAADNPVSLHVRTETTNESGRITIDAETNTTITVYVPSEPETVLFNGQTNAFGWAGGQLTISVPACENSVIDVIASGQQVLSGGGVLFSLIGAAESVGAEVMAQPEPFYINLEEDVDGGWSIAFPSSPDWAYRIEYTASLINPVWMPISEYQVGTGDVMGINGTNAPSVGFFRVRVSAP